MIDVIAMWIGYITMFLFAVNIFYHCFIVGWMMWLDIYYDIIEKINRNKDSEGKVLSTFDVRKYINER